MKDEVIKNSRENGVKVSIAVGGATDRNFNDVMTKIGNDMYDSFLFSFFLFILYPSFLFIVSFFSLSFLFYLLLLSFLYSFFSISILFCFSYHWSSSSPLLMKLVDTISNYVINNNFDGVDLDLESWWASANGDQGGRKSGDPHVLSSFSSFYYLLALYYICFFFFNYLVLACRQSFECSCFIFETKIGKEQNHFCCFAGNLMVFYLIHIKTIIMNYY